MKFRCERETLAEALATAGRAATGRTGTLPVLSGLRLELVGDRLTITGTDLDLTIQLDIQVGGDVDGGVVLPARLSSDIVRALPAGKVQVEVDDDEVRISGGRSQFSVRPLSLDDYPRLATPASSVALPSISQHCPASQACPSSVPCPVRGMNQLCPSVPMPVSPGGKRRSSSVKGASARSSSAASSSPAMFAAGRV